jgi:hypothetical protein
MTTYKSWLIYKKSSNIFGNLEHSHNKTRQNVSPKHRKLMQIYETSSLPKARSPARQIDRRTAKAASGPCDLVPDLVPRRFMDARRVCEYFTSSLLPQEGESNAGLPELSQTTPGASHSTPQPPRASRGPRSLPEQPGAGSTQILAGRHSAVSAGPG